MTMESTLTTDRGKLRMERLRQLELEQLQWDQEALVMPEDLNRALALSFESVKTEFSDLDGLCWPRYPVPLVTNPWALEEPTPKLASSQIDDPDPCDPRTPAHSPSLPQRRPPQRSPGSDTIRVSRLGQPSRSPLQPANQFFSAQYNPSPHNDPLAGSSYLTHSHPPTSLALTCHSLRYPAYGRG